MPFVADFHVHSKYSRATARNLDLENLHISAQKKGIAVVGTGDFTHPGWAAEIAAKLVPAEEGLYTLRPEIARACDEQVPPACRRPVRFMLVTEISNIYKKNERTRKNHNLVFMPDRHRAARFTQRLDALGNVRSDGRPILGLDTRTLLEIVLETTPAGYLVPAHVWTPWFSLLGSKSGFDAVEECFEDLSTHIFALETGLSSDPPMNRRISGLDRFALISNSDAHSPAKLGREANRFDTDLSFGAIRSSLEQTGTNGFLGTIEFFPEEGKYHVDGHRKCRFRCLPEETRALGSICPVCGSSLVLGVLNRVEQLADRPAGKAPADKPFRSLIPLQEILAEVLQTGPTTKTVMKAYDRLLTRFGPEFDILETVPQEDLDRCGIALLGEAIARMRSGRIVFEPGYDGEFGRVRIFDSGERETLNGQQSLFALSAIAAQPQSSALQAGVQPAPEPPPNRASNRSNSMQPSLDLNPEQQTAVDHDGGPLLILAGPGTGKTFTITRRMAAIVAAGRADPANIAAVTFTHKAAREMSERLAAALPGAVQPVVGTFHSLCLQWLLQKGEDGPLTILDEENRTAIMAEAVRQNRNSTAPVAITVRRAQAFVSRAKQRLLGPEEDLEAVATSGEDPAVMARIYAHYQTLLDQRQWVDFEDLIFRAVDRLSWDETWRANLRKRFAHIFVDEFQDLNYSQYRLIRLLAPADADICVIGDPDQAIYGFRGADVTVFTRFMADYPTARIIRLGRNYRSTQTIVQAAAGVIQPHPIFLPGHTRAPVDAHGRGNNRVTIIEAPSARSEAVAIGTIIEQMVGGAGFHSLDFGKACGSVRTRSFSDFAVLNRTAEQARIIADELTRAGIPCRLTSKELFVQKPMVAKLLATLRVMAGQGTHADLNRLGDLLAPGVGKKTLEDFRRWSHGRQLALDQALQTAIRVPIADLSTPRQQRLATLARFLQSLADETRELTVSAAIERVFSATTLAHRLAAQDVEELQIMATPHGRSMGVFLAAQAGGTDTDFYRPDVEKVALMTMHAAKGLEFPVVFVAGCEEGLMPYTQPDRTPEDRHEERRLFYVAMTRAREALYLTWSRRRMRFGKRSPGRPSPFLADIGPALKEHTCAATRPPAQRQLTLF